MEPFAWTIDAAKKYVMSSTLDRVDWSAKLVRSDLRQPEAPPNLVHVPSECRAVFIVRRASDSNC
jgi:hypothetical protein